MHRRAVIRTFESHFGNPIFARRGLRPDVYHVAAAHPASDGDLTPPNKRVTTGPAVVARVDHGRWIADCPTCGGAEFVSFDNPVFFCCSCRNAAAGHDLLPVLIPDLDTRQQIEAHLGSRPDPRTRNWLPHETVDNLRDENRAHKIKLLPE